VSVAACASRETVLTMKLEGHEEFENLAFTFVLFASFVVKRSSLLLRLLRQVLYGQ
jgi:hypothetical protein